MKDSEAAIWKALASPVRRRALDLLKQAGWTIKDRKLVDGSGKQMAFTGTLQQWRREYAAHLAAERGANFANSVTRRSTAI